MAGEADKGKQKLIQFIKEAVKGDFEKLILEHESMRAQCQQLVNQVKVLAQEQIELVNLVMMHQSYISTLERKQKDLHVRFQEPPSDAEFRELKPAVLGEPVAVTLEMQVFDEMQQIIQKYKQQLEAMESVDQDLQRNPTSSMSERRTSSSAKNSADITGKSRKRKKHLRMLYSRMKHIPDQKLPGKAHVEEIRDSAVQTDKHFGASQKKKTGQHKLEMSTTHAADYGPDIPSAFGEGAGRCFSPGIREVSDDCKNDQSDIRNGFKDEACRVAHPRHTISHLFSLLDELKTVSSFAQRRNRVEHEEEDVSEFPQTVDTHLSPWGQRKEDDGKCKVHL